MPLSFSPSALVAVLLVALSIWWSLPVRRASPADFDKVNTMSRSPRRRTSESTFCFNPDSSDGEGYVTSSSEFIRNIPTRSRTTSRR